MSELTEKTKEKKAATLAHGLKQTQTRISIKH